MSRPRNGVSRSDDFPIYAYWLAGWVIYVAATVALTMGSEIFL